MLVLSILAVAIAAKLVAAAALDSEFEKMIDERRFKLGVLDLVFNLEF